MGSRGDEGRRRLTDAVWGRRAVARKGAETETGGPGGGNGGWRGRESSASPAEMRSSVSTTVRVTMPLPPGDDDPSATLDRAAAITDGSSVSPSEGILELNSRAG